MSEKKAKIVFCPNCNQPATRIGDTVTCETCDAEFTITKKDGAKVKSHGRLNFLEERVERLEAQLLGEPESDPAGQSENEPEVPTDNSDNDKDEEEIL